MEYLTELLGKYPSAWIAVATVIAAVIVMYSGYLNLKISRSHVVSGYRQEWINNLREKFSEFLNEVDRILSDLSYKHVDDTFEEQYPSDSQSLQHKLHTVRLFLNKSEKEHIELIDRATQLKDYMLYTSIGNIDFEAIRKDKTILVDLFQDILKDEWNRVKWGERKWKWRKKLISLKYWLRMLLKRLKADSET